MDVHAVSAYRFLANLWWRPRSVWVIVEYWMQNYEPLALDTGALAPATLEPRDFYYTLLARILKGPDDLVLVSQGGLATSADADVPRYVHTLNFIQPAGQDFTLSVPMRHFLKVEDEWVLSSLLPLFYEAEYFWKSVIRPGNMGQCLCDYFHVNGDMLGWRALFPVATFASEVMMRVLEGIQRERSSEWCTTQGLEAIAHWVNAFRDRPENQSQFSVAEDGWLVQYVEDMDRTLRAPLTSSLAKLRRCTELTRVLRLTSHRFMGNLYTRMASVMDCAFCLDDVALLPWNDGEYKELGSGNSTDAMDIDL